MMEIVCRRKDILPLRIKGMVVKIFLELLFAYHGSKTAVAYFLRLRFIISLNSFGKFIANKH